MSGGLRGTLKLALVVAGLGAGSLSACQAQDAPAESKPLSEMLQPISVKTEPPYIMLVVDKSGSMADSEHGGAGCRDVMGTYHPGGPCKWTSVLEAFTDPATGFLPRAGRENSAQVGLTLFPGANPSGEPSECEIGDVAVALDPVADGIEQSIAKLKAAVPAGGTPTASTLRQVAQDPMLQPPADGVARKRFVLLLTDGVPNCNPANAQRCLDCAGDLNVCQSEPDGCRPTWGEPDRCDQFVSFIGAACLDDRNTVEAVRELKEQGVETFVIGFGLETAKGTVAGRVINAAAEIGGRAREDSETKYYQAGTRAELDGILEHIGDQIIQSCNFQIAPAPTSPETVRLVLVDTVEMGERELVQGQHWRFTTDALNEIAVLGEPCALIKEAQPERYELQFR